VRRQDHVGRDFPDGLTPSAFITVYQRRKNSPCRGWVANSRVAAFGEGRRIAHTSISLRGTADYIIQPPINGDERR